MFFRDNAKSKQKQQVQEQEPAQEQPTLFLKISHTEIKHLRQDFYKIANDY
jgi:hypothetical protein